MARKKVYVKKPKTDKTKDELRAKKSIDNYGNYVEGWENQLKFIFDDSTEEFKKMMTIINNAKKANLPHQGNHSHHIIPRSYYKKYNKEIDNSEKNLVNLTPVEHYIVHFYAWKCARKVMKTSMAYAFRLMYSLAEKNVSEDNVVYFAKAYSDAWNAKIYTLDLKELQERYKNCVYEPIKLTSKQMVFRCRVCGNIKKIARDNHYNYPNKRISHCWECYYTENFTNKRYALVFIIGQDNKAYWKTIDIKPYMNDKGLISYKYAKTVVKHGLKKNNNSYKKFSFIKLLDEDIKPDSRHISQCGRCFMKNMDEKTLKGYAFLVKNHMEPQTFLGHTKGNLISVLKRKKLLDKDFEPSNNNYKPVAIYEYKQFGFHTASEWEEILGMNYYQIYKNFTIIHQNMNVVDFFMKCEDWRKALDELRKILEFMEEYNSDNPNWSFDDANNRAFPVE